MKISVYTSLYNLGNNLFDWESKLAEFIDFADELVVATTSKCKDDTIEQLRLSSVLSNRGIFTPERFKLIITDIPFDDLAFDGKLKDAALQACTGDVCCLLDMDESPYNWSSWEDIGSQLIKSSFDGILIPTIDLFHDANHYKSIGFKWYMHKNHKGIHRGVVNFARLPNGKIDHTKSDTTEPIYANGSLINAAYLIEPNISDSDKLDIIRNYDLAHVIHTGWLDKEKRKKASEFWQPVWSNRAGFEVNSGETDETLSKIPYYPHNLNV